MALTVNIQIDTHTIAVIAIRRGDGPRSPDPDDPVDYDIELHRPTDGLLTPRPTTSVTHRPTDGPLALASKALDAFTLEPAL